MQLSLKVCKLYLLLCLGLSTNANPILSGIKSTSSNDPVIESQPTTYVQKPLTSDKYYNREQSFDNGQSSLYGQTFQNYQQPSSISNTQNVGIKSNLQTISGQSLTNVPGVTTTFRDQNGNIVTQVKKEIVNNDKDQSTHVSEFEETKQLPNGYSKSFKKEYSSSSKIGSQPTTFVQKPLTTDKYYNREQSFNNGQFSSYGQTFQNYQQPSSISNTQNFGIKSNLQTISGQSLTNVPGVTTTFRDQNGNIVTQVKKEIVNNDKDQSTHVSEFEETKQLPNGYSKSFKKEYSSSSKIGSQPTTFVQKPLTTDKYYNREQSFNNGQFSSYGQTFQNYQQPSSISNTQNFGIKSNLQTISGQSLTNVPGVTTTFRDQNGNIVTQVKKEIVNNDKDQSTHVSEFEETKQLPNGYSKSFKKEYSSSSKIGSQPTTFVQKPLTLDSGKYSKLSSTGQKPDNKNHFATPSIPNRQLEKIESFSTQGQEEVGQQSVDIHEFSKTPSIEQQKVDLNKYSKPIPTGQQPDNINHFATPSIPNRQVEKIESFSTQGQEEVGQQSVDLHEFSKTPSIEQQKVDLNKYSKPIPTGQQPDNINHFATPSIPNRQLEKIESFSTQGQEVGQQSVDLHEFSKTPSIEQQKVDLNKYSKPIPTGQQPDNINHFATPSIPNRQLEKIESFSTQGQEEVGQQSVDLHELSKTPSIEQQKVDLNKYSKPIPTGQQPVNLNNFATPKTSNRQFEKIESFSTQTKENVGQQAVDCHEYSKPIPTGQQPVNLNNFAIPKTPNRQIEKFESFSTQGQEEVGQQSVDLHEFSKPSSIGQQSEDLYEFSKPTPTGQQSVNLNNFAIPKTPNRQIEKIESFSTQGQEVGQQSVDLHEFSKPSSIGQQSEDLYEFSKPTPTRQQSVNLNNFVTPKTPNKQFEKVESFSTQIHEEVGQQSVDLHEFSKPSSISQQSEDLHEFSKLSSTRQQPVNINHFATPNIRNRQLEKIESFSTQGQEVGQQSVDLHELSKTPSIEQKVHLNKYSKPIPTGQQPVNLNNFATPKTPNRQFEKIESFLTQGQEDGQQSVDLHEFSKPTPTGQQSVNLNNFVTLKTPNKQFEKVESFSTQTHEEVGQQSVDLHEFSKPSSIGQHLEDLHEFSKPTPTGQQSVNINNFAKPKIFNSGQQLINNDENEQINQQYGVVDHPIFSSPTNGQQIKPLESLTSHFKETSHLLDFGIPEQHKQPTGYSKETFALQSINNGKSSGQETAVFEKHRTLDKNINLRNSAQLPTTVNNYQENINSNYQKWNGQSTKSYVSHGQESIDLISNFEGHRPTYQTQYNENIGLHKSEFSPQMGKFTENKNLSLVNSKYNSVFDKLNQLEQEINGPKSTVNINKDNFQTSYLTNHNLKSMPVQTHHEKSYFSSTTDEKTQYIEPESEIVSNSSLIKESKSFEQQNPIESQTLIHENFLEQPTTQSTVWRKIGDKVKGSIQNVKNRAQQLASNINDKVGF